MAGENTGNNTSSNTGTGTDTGGNTGGNAETNTNTNTGTNTSTDNSENANTDTNTNKTDTTDTTKNDAENASNSNEAGATNASGVSVAAPTNTSGNIKELSKIPVYTPFVSAYKKKKTANGIVLSDSATLKRYYSSIDAEIYFNNEYVEDVSDIEWHIQQQNHPLFGFNSYTFDEIAVGARIIQGQFSIRFTSPNYLFKLLEAAKADNIIRVSGFAVALKDRNVGEATGDIDESLLGEVAGTNESELWPQTFDIDVVYGKPSRNVNEVHVILENVRILSCASGASASSPVPLTEVYSFVAKDIKTLA